MSGMLRVLRLCSVFEPRDLTPAWVAYDPIGGMQNHAAELTRCLDRLGVGQLVVTSRLAGPADTVRFGAHGQVIRVGLRVPVLRQGWAPLAVRHVLGAGRVDLVHVHCGEDVAVLPLARLAALRHGCPVVVTVHLSVRHALRPATPRGVVLRAAGGAAERWLLPGMAAVIALTPSAARLLRGDGIPAGRVHVIPPGYDPALFAAAAADPFPGLPRPRVAYLGGWRRRRMSARCWRRSRGCPRARSCWWSATARTGRRWRAARSGSAAGCISPGSCRMSRSRRCCGTWTCSCSPACMRTSARR
jgi:glycosyltransferase involved in cell wall biosynthesis